MLLPSTVPARWTFKGRLHRKSSGHRHFSGTGGQLGFVRAAYQSNGGRAFLCMPSTYEKDGVRKSRVVVDLPGGTIVTVPRTDVMYAATEFGIVCLKGKAVAERAKAMISIAHPDFSRGTGERSIRKRAHTAGFLLALDIVTALKVPNCEPHYWLCPTHQRYSEGGSFLIEAAMYLGRRVCSTGRTSDQKVSAMPR